MKKIPTLFAREFANHRVIGITDEITAGCEDALLHGTATIKIDGACCAILGGELYKRYDAKKGKKPPEGAIPCCDQPTVYAVPAADMRSFAEDVVCQFGYYCQNKGRLHITHGGLSTLEWAFDILGWENPHPVPEFECEIEGCHEHATCGTPTADGYKRVCGKHYRSIRAKMDGDGNA